MDLFLLRKQKPKKLFKWKIQKSEIVALVKRLLISKIYMKNSMTKQTYIIIRVFFICKDLRFVSNVYRFQKFETKTIKSNSVNFSNLYFVILAMALTFSFI